MDSQITSNSLLDSTETDPPPQSNLPANPMDSQISTSSSLSDSTDSKPRRNLLSMSNEILGLIVDELDFELTRGRIYGPGTDGECHSDGTWIYPDMRDSDEAHRQRLHELAQLCLTCHKLAAVTLPYLYRRVVLLEDALLMSKKEVENDNPPTDQPGEPVWQLRYVAGDAPLLFLRTLLENPALRRHARRLDCRVFLEPYEDGPENPLRYRTVHGDADVVDWSMMADQWNGFTKSAPFPTSQHDRHVLQHVGLALRGGAAFLDPPPLHLDQRILVAILSLVPNVHALSIFCQREPWFAGYSTYYGTLNHLIETAMDDPILGNSMLPKLQSISFSGDPAMLLPSDGVHNVRVHIPLGLIKAPKLNETVFSIEPSNWSDIARCNPRIASLYTSLRAPTFDMDNAEHFWELRKLFIRTHGAEAASIQKWDNVVDRLDAVIRSQKTTLEVLDVGHSLLFYPSRALRSLQALTQLRILRIFRSLLATVRDFDTIPLSLILPRTLEQLVITDNDREDWGSDKWNGCGAAVGMEWDDPRFADFIAGTENVDRDEFAGRRNGALFKALCKFRPVRAETHPKLEWIFVETIHDLETDAGDIERVCVNFIMGLVRRS